MKNGGIYKKCDKLATGPRTKRRLRHTLSDVSVLTKMMSSDLEDEEAAHEERSSLNILSCLSTLLFLNVFNFSRFCGFIFCIFS